MIVKDWFNDLDLEEPIANSNSKNVSFDKNAEKVEEFGPRKKKPVLTKKSSVLLEKAT